MQRKRLLLLIVFVSMLMTACSYNIANPSYNEIEVKEFQWQSFTWIPYEINGTNYEKAALFIPIEFEDSKNTERKYLLQLDTGIFNPKIDGITFNSINPPHEILVADGGEGIIFNGRIAGYDVKKMLSAVRKEAGVIIDESVPMEINVGSLGLQFFLGKILVLDFPNNKLSITTSEKQLPADLAENVTYYPAKIMNNFFTFDININGNSYKVAYDTGHSLFPLVLNQDLWQKFTGREGSESENSRFAIPAWGNMIPMVGAPAQNEIFLSKLSLGYPEVYYREKEPELLKGTGFDAIMGNKPFYDDSIIIFDLINMRFGVVKTVD